MSQPGHVVVTLQGVLATRDRRALPEASDASKEAFVAKGPAMFMEPVEESEFGVVAMPNALEVARTLGMHPESAKQLSRVVLETLMCAFKRRLTGDPAVDVEPLKIALRRDKSLDWLNRQVVRASVAVEISKGRAHGLVQMRRLETGRRLIQCLQATKR